MVFVICNLRGESMRATNDVEKSISNNAMSPSFVSKHFANGSVVYMRNPLDVPGDCMLAWGRETRAWKTDPQPNGYSPD